MNLKWANGCDTSTVYKLDVQGAHSGISPGKALSNVLPHVLPSKMNLFLVYQIQQPAAHNPV